MKKIVDVSKKVCTIRNSRRVAIGADILFVINLVYCIISYFKLNESMTEAFVFDMFLEYMFGQVYKTLLYQLCIWVLCSAVIFLFGAYIFNKKTKMSKVLLGLFVVMISLLGLLGVLKVISLIFADFSLLYSLCCILLISLIFMLLFISEMIFIFDKEYRKTALVLFFSMIWILMGVILLVAVFIWLIVKVLSFLFVNQSQGRIMEERDMDGNLIRRWREE